VFDLSVYVSGCECGCVYSMCCDVMRGDTYLSGTVQVVQGHQVQVQTRILFSSLEISEIPFPTQKV